MPARILTLLLAVGLGFGVLTLVPKLAGYRLPGNQQGYEPKQPIAFSHQLHAGELQISCQYCHSGAEKGRYAGIPAVSVCMNCHKSVTGPLGAKGISPELAKLYEYLALDDKLQPDPNKAPKPIPWVRVHNLPDFASFDHRAHVGAGVACQKCHGPVETMPTVRQVESLSMGWCVNCHRDVNRTGVGGKTVRASLDCAACHY